MTEQEKADKLNEVQAKLAFISQAMSVMLEQENSELSALGRLSCHL